MSKVLNKTAGQIIFIQGQTCTNVFILQSGSVSLSVARSNSDFVVNTMLKSGDFFGIISAVGGYPCEATAKAETDSVIVELSLTEFKEMILSKKNLFKNILFNMAKVAREHISLLSANKDKLLMNADKRLYENAKSFFDEGSFTSCFEVCNRYIERFPELLKNTEIEKLRQISGIRIQNKVDESKTPLQQFIRENGKIPHDKNGSKFNITAFKNFLQIYDRGEVICAEGERERKFYYLDSGEVFLCKNIEGVNSYISRCLPGDFFEVLPAIDEDSHATTAIAGSFVKVLEFSPENFDLIFSTNVEMAYFLLQKVIYLIHNAEEISEVFKYPTMRERISAIIYMLAESDRGRSKIDPHSIGKTEIHKITEFTRQIEISFSNISALLHASKKEIVDRLKFMESEGLLKMIGDDVLIIFDINKLK